MSLLFAYPLLGLVMLAGQIFFVIHAVRTGRTMWIFVILFFPVLGCLAYLFAEYLPSERLAAGQLKKVQEGVIRKIAPEVEIRRYADQVALSPSLVNRMELGRAYARAGRLDEALGVYTGCLEGYYASDPVLLFELARTYHAAGDAANARDFYERFRAQTTPTKEQQLLSARIHELAGEDQAALEQYAVLARQSAGQEARTRYALLLRHVGREEEARQIFDEVLRHARISSRVYRRAQKEWIDVAKAELKRGEPALR
jgi:hypothetical protein